MKKYDEKYQNEIESMRKEKEEFLQKHQQEEEEWNKQRQSFQKEITALKDEITI